MADSCEMPMEQDPDSGRLYPRRALGQPAISGVFNLAVVTPVGSPQHFGGVASDYVQYYNFCIIISFFENLAVDF